MSTVPRIKIVSTDGTMTKARILLMVALTRTADPDELQRIFDEY